MWAGAKGQNGRGVARVLAETRCGEVPIPMSRAGSKTRASYAACLRGATVGLDLIVAK